MSSSGLPINPSQRPCASLLGRAGGTSALGSAPEELTRLVPELTEVVQGLPEALEATPDAERLRLFDATRSWLGELAADAPVLLVLDDLHWADAGTLLLLRHVTVSEPVPHLLVVGTYRDTDVDRGHPLAPMLAELRRRGEVIRIALSGLDASEVSDLMTLVAGHDLEADGVSLALAVQGETAGNPFFVGELLRHLAESGAIVQTDGRWVAARPGEDQLLPEGIREVVGRRVSALPDSTQQALSIAAVIGVDFELAVLAMVSGNDEDLLIDALESAVTANLVTEVGVDHYRFAHALVRSTLRAELSTTRCARLHRAVALTLEAIHSSDLNAVITDLAYHWGEAGAAATQEHAVGYARRAAEMAYERVAPEEAVRWYTQAREVLDGADPVLDAELAARLAEAMAMVGMPGWREAELEAARAAEVLGDAALMAESLCINRRTVLVEGSPEDPEPEKIALLHRALELCPEGDRSLWARLTATLAGELLYTGDLTRRKALSESLMRYEVEMDDPYERLQLRLGGALALVGRRRQWMERYQADALASVAVTGGDSLKHANSFFGLFMSSMELGDQAWRGALAEFQAVIARYPHPILADLQPFLEMIAGVIDGRPSDVEASATELGRLWTSHGRGLEAQVYQNSGLLQAAREKTGLEPLLDLLVGNPLYNPNKPGAITGIMALALAESGQLDRTRDHIETFGAHDFADIADDAAQPVAHSTWAEAAALVRHDRACEIFYERLQPFSDVHQSTGGWYLGATARYLGLLSDALGSFQEANEWFALAEREHEMMHTPPWLARGRLDWAEALMRRGETKHANQMARSALQVIGDLELKVSQSRAEKLLRND